LWAAAGSPRLPADVRHLIEAPDTEPLFSAASIWEVAIKAVLGRADFQVDAGLLRRGLLDHGYCELPIAGNHAAATAHLPPLHRDPFDRLLVAQALAEGVLLLTADEMVARYPGPVRFV
jgi:PIN domain nuclease of toxin-antitoxin system